MLIYSKKRYTPTDINMMVIAGNDGYYYVHRALYDQAVILHDMYKDNISGLVDILKPGAEITESIHRFVTEVPAPINVLGAFLILVKEDITSLVDMVGAIHVMSGPLDLRKMITVPIEMRQAIQFSLSITEEYQPAWDRFFVTAIPYGEQPVMHTKSIEVAEVEEEEEESEESDIEDIDSVDDYLANLDWDALMEDVELPEGYMNPPSKSSVEETEVEAVTEEKEEPKRIDPSLAFLEGL